MNAERGGGITEDDPRKWPVTREAMKARDTRLMRRELFQQKRRCRREFARFELRCIAGRSLDDVGEAESVIKQGGVMLRDEGEDIERTPRRRAQYRT